MRKVVITIVVLFFVVISMVCAQVNSQLRLREIAQNGNSSIFAIEIKSSDAADFNMAGINLRLYYDSKTTKFDAQNSFTTLPQSSYSDLKVVNDLYNFDASQAGQLSFDKNLGFINLAIDLVNFDKGSVVVTPQEWVSLAELSFENANNATPNIIWADKNITDKYAPAFVQATSIVNYNTYNALRMTKSVELLNDKANSIAFNAQVFPSVTNDFATLSVNTDNDVEMIVRNINGAVISTQSANAYDAKNMNIDLSNEASGSYVVEVVNKSNGKKIANRISKVSK